MVGHARFNPWLYKQADFQMGHLLKRASYRRQRRIKHLVRPIPMDIGHV